MGISIKAARVNAGYKLFEAAEELGVSVCTLANYEKGKTEPSYTTVRKMSQLYKQSIDDLNFCPTLPFNGNCGRERSNP